jgi:hypothetical protein
VDHTSSLPSWLTSGVHCDASARSLHLVGIGKAAVATVDRWRAEAAPTLSITTLLGDQLDAATVTAFDSQLATAVLGWRLMLAGSEADVGLLHARAVQAGAEDDEIAVLVTERKLGRVYCAHCAATLTPAEATTAGTPERVWCPSCRRLLSVRPHYSPRHAAYLGVAQLGLADGR